MIFLQYCEFKEKISFLLEKIKHRSLKIQVKSRHKITKELSQFLYP